MPAQTLCNDWATASEAEAGWDFERHGFPNLGDTCYMGSIMQCLLALPGFASLVHHEHCTAQCHQPCLMSALHVSAATSHATSPVPPTVCCWEPLLESWGITFHEQQDAIEVLQEIAKRLPHDLWKCFDVMCITHQQRTFGCQCHASAITSHVVSTFHSEVYDPEIDTTLQNLLLETTTWDE